MKGLRNYYGHLVRALFVLIVLITFVSIPFWGDLLPFGPLFEIVGGVALIVLAGLTSPKSRVVLLLDSFAAAFGALVLELTAVFEFGAEGMTLLVLREVTMFLCLIALYLCMRTLRAMAQANGAA